MCTKGMYIVYNVIENDIEHKQNGTRQINMNWLEVAIESGTIKSVDALFNRTHNGICGVQM